MEIYRLRYFSAVAKTGNMRRAAELLHVSPAALSKAVGVLERELGTKLIVPSGRGIVISDTGKLLVARIDPLLADLERIADEIRGEKAETEASLRLASFEVFTTWLLGPVIEKHFAGHAVLVHELLPGQMENAVADGVVDIAITYIPVPSQQLDHLKVASLEMGVFGKKNAFRGVDFDDLPFAAPISPVAGSPNKVRGLDGWPDDTVPRKVRYQVTLMESAMEFCRRGMAVAYLPVPVVKRHNECVKDAYALSPLPFPKLPERSTRQSIYLIKRKSDSESPSLKKLAAAMRLL